MMTLKLWLEHSHEAGKPEGKEREAAIYIPSYVC